MGRFFNLNFKLVILFLFAFLNIHQNAFAYAAPISANDANSLLVPNFDYQKEYQKKETKIPYIQKSEEFNSFSNQKIQSNQQKVQLKPPIAPQKTQSKIVVETPKTQEIKLNNIKEKTPVKLQGNNELAKHIQVREDGWEVYNKKEEKEKIKEAKKREEGFHLITKNPSDRIISQSIRTINAIYPQDDISPTNTFPGYRGSNQLVIYNRGYGKTTGTNEFGKEAIVEDGIVVALTGANSNIPRDGFVISGHGSAKKWISDNLKIGTKIEILDRTIKAYTTIESYRYFAKAKINDVEDILISTKSDYDFRDDKFIYYYLKKAKQQLKKSKKDSSNDSLECAKEAIESASLAFRYTLPYLQNELKGTWIRPSETSIQQVQKTLDKIKDTGINNVFLETYFHGKTIFPSETMRKYGFEEQNPNFNYDALAVWIKEAHRRNIKLHVWFESFYIGNKSPETNSKSILALNPSWMNRTKQKADYEGYVSHPQEHNGYFLDPANPEVKEFLYDLITEITTKYNIDGLNIDYVRYPNIAKENLNNQWGYTKYAREEFKNIYEIDPIDIKPRDSKWDDWCDYRKDQITQYIAYVSKIAKSKNIMFSAVIFPDYKISLQTKFQDWTRWLDEGYLDAITPLILTGDDSLAKSMLEEIKKKAMHSAKVYPGLFAGFIESDPEDLLRQIHIIRKLELNGVILFDWAHLNDNYRDVLKTSAFREQTY